MLRFPPSIENGVRMSHQIWSRLRRTLLVGILLVLLLVGTALSACGDEGKYGGDKSGAFQLRPNMTYP